MNETGTEPKAGWATKFLVGFVIAVGFGLSLVTWAHWMGDNSREDFAELCYKLDAVPNYDHDWLCIRDDEVVYP